MAAFAAAAPALTSRAFFAKSSVTKARASAKMPRAAFKVEAAKKSVGDLKEADLKGKTVFIRCDLNVPLDGAKITDDTRIRAAIPTLEYLAKNGAKVLVTSHLVRDRDRRARDERVVYPLIRESDRDERGATRRERLTRGTMTRAKIGPTEERTGG